MERDKLRRIREDTDKQVATLQRRRAKVLREVTKACDATRGRLRDATADYRASERERINKKIGAERAKVTAQCERRRLRVRKTVQTARELAKVEEDERLRRARALSTVQRKQRAELAKADTRAKRREVRQESSDEVEQNIDPGLVPVWRKHGRTIKATPHISRTEAFLQFVEENEGEVWAAREAETARELAKLQREQWKQAKQYEEAVPF